MFRVFPTSLALLVIGCAAAFAGEATDYLDGDLLDMVGDGPSLGTQPDTPTETSYGASLRAGYDTNYEEDVVPVGSRFLEATGDAEHIWYSRGSSRSIEASLSAIALPELDNSFQSDASFAGGMRMALGPDAEYGFAARAELDATDDPLTLGTSWATGVIHKRGDLAAGLRLSLTTDQDVEDLSAPFAEPIAIDALLEGAVVIDPDEPFSKYVTASLERSISEPAPLLAYLTGGLRGPLSDAVSFDVALIAAGRVPTGADQAAGATLIPDLSLKWRVAEGLTARLSTGGEIYSEDEDTGAAMETYAAASLDYESSFGLDLSAILTQTTERTMAWAQVEQEHTLDLEASYVLIEKPEIKLTAARSYSLSKDGLETVDRITIGTGVDTSF